jgi:heme-degrading monooxygenase HmoA
MFLRVVRVKVREGGLWPFREYYERHILPALVRTEGCLFAALLRPAAEDEATSCDSLTLWDTCEHAEAYVASGLYDELLDGADPFLAAVTEWKADLSRLQPVQRPPLPDPTVDTYPVEVAREASSDHGSTALFLRIVDHRVEPARFEELRKTYEDVLAPSLVGTPGCLAAYLVEGPRGKSQALSVTLWDDEASAVRYESSGRFDDLAAQLQPFLSGLYHWRLSLTSDGEERSLRGSDLAVSGFHVLAGRRIHPGER